jgi:hypothetical protein
MLVLELQVLKEGKSELDPRPLVSAGWRLRVISRGSKYTISNHYQ